MSSLWYPTCSRHLLKFHSYIQNNSYCSCIFLFFQQFRSCPTYYIWFVSWDFRENSENMSLQEMNLKNSDIIPLFETCMYRHPTRSNCFSSLCQGSMVAMPYVSPRYLWCFAASRPCQHNFSPKNAEACASLCWYKRRLRNVVDENRQNKWKWTSQWLKTWLP